MGIPIGYFLLDTKSKLGFSIPLFELAVLTEYYKQLQVIIDFVHGILTVQLSHCFFFAAGISTSSGIPGPYTCTTVIKQPKLLLFAYPQTSEALREFGPWPRKASNEPFHRHRQ